MASSSSSSKPNTIKLNTETDCPVKSVTVYGDRAEVTRKLDLNLSVPGDYDVLLEGGTLIDQNSIHVGGGDASSKITILEVSYNVIRKTGGDASKLAEQQKRLEEINTKISQINDENERYRKERQWLEGRATKLMNFVGSEKGQATSDAVHSAFSKESFQEIDNFMEYYHRTLARLDSNNTRLVKELKETNKQKDNLNSEIHSSHATTSTEKIEITISIRVSDKGQFSLDLSYVILGCSWSPAYDIRVDSESGETQITYYGVITNRSSENWNETSLSLSTASPLSGGAPPELPSLNAQFKTSSDIQKFDKKRATSYSQQAYMAQNPLYSLPPPPKEMKRKSSVSNIEYEERLSMSDEDEEEDDEDFASNESPRRKTSISKGKEKTLNVLTATTTTSMSSSSFKIPRATTIESDGKPHKVTIAVIELKARFTYTLVPKLTQHAFIKATLTNSTELPFLPGPINVFMNFNFVAQSHSKAVGPGEKFVIFLGTDAGIKVEYKPVRKMKAAISQGIIVKTNTEKQTVLHETVISNNKNGEVALVIADQVPISSVDKIKVTVLQPDLKKKEEGMEVKLNSSNNIEWRLILPAKKEIVLPFEYVVEFPSGSQVEIV